MNKDFEDDNPNSYCNEEDTKYVVIGRKQFHLEAVYDGIEVKSIHLTEFGDSERTEMLMAFDMYPKD